MIFARSVQADISFLLLTTFIRAVDSDRRWNFRRHFYKTQRRNEAVIIEGRYFGTSSVKQISLKAQGDDVSKSTENSKRSVSSVLSIKRCIPHLNSTRSSWPSYTSAVFSLPQSIFSNGLDVVGPE